jgi:uncharacterized membrane protein
MVSAEKMKTKNLVMTSLRKIILCLIFAISAFFSNGSVHANESIVRAILFYSPSCPHCHQVITEDLPPLVENHQEQLYILAINTYTPEGQTLFKAAIDFYNIPRERQGVPMLLVGDVVLVGSFEIPDQLPHIITEGLAQGGIEWPEFPQLLSFLEEQNLNPAEESNNPEEKNLEEEVVSQQDNPENDQVVVPQQENTLDNLEQAIGDIENMTVAEKFSQDEIGNSISVIVLVSMIFVVWKVGRSMLNPPKELKLWPSWVTPILVFIGLAVSLYLAFVEVNNTEAICGPVGDCNTVQQSSYAYLFGIIPIGVLGVIGYLVIILTWLINHYGPPGWQRLGTWALFCFTFFGTSFSIYLTFLEPFVIGATCAWCLSSAVVMTLLLVHAGGYVLAYEGT